MKRRFYVPLLTYPDATSDAFVDSAVDLAVNCNAVLNAMVFNVTIPPISTPWPTFVDTTDMVREAEKQSRHSGKALANLLRDRSAETSLDCEISSDAILQSELVTAAISEARLNDLVAMQSGVQFASFAEELIFDSGRPVILYPEERCSGRFDHIVIAWDGSRAAARAVADAQFLLSKAVRVTVIYDAEEKSHVAEAATKFGNALASKGLDVETASVTRAGYIGDLLQLKAVELGGDLLVMGGFGHSRLREFVLGGATADVLSKTRLPVLMSH